MSKRKSTVTAVRPADESHQVIEVTSSGGQKLYRRKPCGDCPWRVDATGVFPAEAFRISAPTSYDMSQSTFACHQSGQKKPATCAGFLLRAEHNLSIRMAVTKGEIDLRKVTDGGCELHDGYREMAIANGVDPDDPAIQDCR